MYRFQKHWSGHGSDRDLSGDLTLWHQGFVAFRILLKSTSYVHRVLYMWGAYIGRTSGLLNYGNRERKRLHAKKMIRRKEKANQKKNRCAPHIAEFAGLQFHKPL